MIITISGMPGSGKSTIGKMLAKKRGYNFYSIGDLRGKIAMDRGITIHELNEIGKKEDWTDREADEYQVELAKKEDNFVVDGRLSFHFIPKSFKIFLDVDSKEAAERVFQNQRPDEEYVDNVEDLEKMMNQRIENDSFRYQKYYGIDFSNHKNYDLVIDTTNLATDEILAKIEKVLDGK